MRCQNCGFENVDGANFCSNCGATLKQTSLAERRIVTILFADLSNFTKISESRDPEDVLNIVNTIFYEFEKIVERYDGHIDKYLGDGIMVLFGAPIAHEDDPERAVRCGIEFLRSLRGIRQKLGEDISLKVSINTGLVVSGFTGGKTKRMYTVIGDAVNVAEKINDLVPPDTIMVTEKIAEYTSQIFEFREYGEFQIHGREEPVKIYRYEGTKEETDLTTTFKSKLTPLVGRKKEMEILVNQLEQVKTGSSYVVTILGEPGVGKSRLKYELKKYCEENSNFRIIEANCRSQSREITYEPIIQIIKEIFNISYFDSNEEKSSKIEKLSLALGISQESKKTIYNMLGIESSMYTEKPDVFSTITEILKRASIDKPHLLIIEDIHWIDDASMEVIRFLLEKLSEMRIFILLTLRPSQSLALPDFPFILNIVLSNLNKEEAKELLKHLLDVEDIPEQFADVLYKKTEGNPLFLEELVERLYKDRFFKIENGKVVILKDLDLALIPDKITNLFLQEIDKLPPDTKQLAKVASVIGREFTKKLLNEIWHGSDLETHLKRLEDAGLAFKDKTSKDRYIFKHSFVRDAAYNLLPKSELKELHKRVGEAIENVFKDQIKEYYETLAFHFEKGEDYHKAFSYNLRTGINLAKLRMYSAANLKLKQAESLLEKIKKGKISITEMFQLNFWYALVLKNIGILKEALAKAEIAAKLAFETNDSIYVRDSIILTLEIKRLIGLISELSREVENYKNILPELFYKNLNLWLQIEKGQIDADKISIEELYKNIRNEKNPLEIIEHLILNAKALSISSLYNEIKNIGELLKKIELKLKVSEEELPGFLLGKIKIHVYSNDIDKLKEDLKTASIYIKRESGDENYIRYLMFQSYFYREQGEFAQAKQLLNLAKGICEEIPNIYLKGLINYHLAKLSYFYIGEKIGAINLWGNSLENFNNSGDRKYGNLAKLYIWLANFLIGKAISYENLPESIKPDEDNEFYKIQSGLYMILGINEIFAGSQEEGLRSIFGVNLFYCDTDILIPASYALLLTYFLTKEQKLEDLLKRIIFVLSSKSKTILEREHLQSIQNLFYVIETQQSAPDKYKKINEEAQQPSFIRESWLIFDAANTFLRTDIENEEKIFLLEENLTQMEILGQGLNSLITQALQLMLAKRTGHPLAKEKEEIFANTLRKYNYLNLVQHMKNLNES